MKRALMLLMSWVACTQLMAAPRSEDLSFESHGVTLAGSLVLPDGDLRGAVVFVHGSGKQSRNLHLAERFAQDGIAALVYDKRGAGKSGGTYEEEHSVGENNLVLLADDAVAGVQASGPPR